MEITMLGTRGSVPVNGSDYQEFGGATTCVRVRTKDQGIYLDLGSGIVGAECDDNRNISVLLSHAHLDHLIGLPFFYALTQKNRSIDIFLKPRNSLSLRHILQYLFTPPLWPVGIFDYPADVHMHGITDNFKIGDVIVCTMEGNHPGGATVYRITSDNSSMVFATDYEHNTAIDKALIEFSKDCDLLIYDGQYSAEEYDSHRGYGHSTAEHGIEIARECNASNLLITHHAPEHNDRVLTEMELAAKKLYNNISFARDGMKIVL